MSAYQFFLPAFDPECRKVFHPDRQGAQAQLVAMEVWNRATNRDLKGRRLVVYRCTRCWGYHVAARHVPPQATETHGGANDPRAAAPEFQMEGTASL